MKSNLSNSTLYDETTSVLIVGGSLVGLSMSLLLSRQGVDSLLVERHPGTAIHPRVASLTARTMEIFRSAGAESAIRGVEPEFTLGSNVPLGESLVAEPVDNLMEDFSAYFTDASPVTGSLIAQDVLESVLPKLAAEGGGELRYKTELVSFEQDEDGVTATIHDLVDGNIRSVRAKYLIAADGSRSRTRKNLGIGHHGAEGLGHNISILFTATGLMEEFRKREAVMCFLANDTVAGALTAYPGSTARPDVFRLDIPYDPDEETVDDFTEGRCLPLIQAAIGIPNFPVQVKTILAWEMVARIADTFQQGRVFLVGDAARAQPPTGALGGNTGIAEAQNLAWKMAAVVRGEANQQLLDTYDMERRKLADFTVEQVTLLSQQRFNEGSEGITVDTLAINMGFRYNVGAIVQESTENLPLVQRPEYWTGQPGTRAPHIVVKYQEKQMSILDLYSNRFVLLIGSAGQNWLNAAKSISDQLRSIFDIYRIGSHGEELIDLENTFYGAYGITPTGAVLIRPDGFVGWRKRDSVGDVGRSEMELSQAFAQILFHDQPTLKGGR